MSEVLTHTFHIPVMGTGFTIDTPVKVAHYGISSVISLVDDLIMEKMREFYCKQLDIPFQPIPNKSEDARAERITTYLNLVDKIVKDKCNAMKESILGTQVEIEKYMDLLPDMSSVKKKFLELKQSASVQDLYEWLQENLAFGSIDVNIMTKLDRENYRGDQRLPMEFNDAHSALRGYAQSDLRSSIVLSAGINPRLYSYFENFEDFYPDSDGVLRKKIIVKVSDYRSAIIQGKFLAKKGLWVSEYRIESGLNCGGHAFATDGYLMGPILEEFKNNRETLIRETHEMYCAALESRNRLAPETPYSMRITAQGGIGTAEEHQFLLEYYGLDCAGWGTPFLLVPEAVNVDEATLQMLCDAGEDDVHLSNISPLGVPFNSLKGNTKDIEKRLLIAKGRPGSSCPKKYVSLNTEFTSQTICLASRQYQKLKIDQLAEQNLPEEEYNEQFGKITEKSCICVGLGTSALLVNNLDTKTEGTGVSVCPGPNIAYFSKRVSLKEMVDHIYGRTNIIEVSNRPNMFIKELKIYVQYLQDKINDAPKPLDDKQVKYFMLFQKNLNEGIEYYRNLFSASESHSAERETLLEQLGTIQDELNTIEILTELVFA